MKLCTALTAFAVLAVTASCAPSGYYDANGVYRAYGQGDTSRYNKPANVPVAVTAPVSTQTYYTTPSSPTTTIVYDRQGYYDRSGHYVASDSGPGVPARYFPPHGMCRIWFNGRDVDDQPSIESCQGIQARVPEGAYVIYGG